MHMKYVQGIENKCPIGIFFDKIYFNVWAM